MAVNQRDYLVIDACVLLNLFATGVIREILGVISQNSVICVLVKNESHYLRKEDDVSEIESFEIETLINQGIIKLCALEDAYEQNLFVNLTADLDDGEAMSMAIALSRNWHLATDDKKARRVFTENAQNISRLGSTTDLIKEWAENENTAALKIKSILLKIERKASFRPAKSDMNLQWWNDILSAE